MKKLENYLKSSYNTLKILDRYLILKIFTLNKSKKGRYEFDPVFKTKVALQKPL